MWILIKGITQTPLPCIFRERGSLLRGGFCRERKDLVHSHVGLFTNHLMLLCYINVSECVISRPACHISARFHILLSYVMRSPTWLCSEWIKRMIRSTCSPLHRGGLHNVLQNVLQGATIYNSRTSTFMQAYYNTKSPLVLNVAIKCVFSESAMFRVVYIFWGANVIMAVIFSKVPFQMIQSIISFYN